jgi:hypothetical protein
MDNYLENKKLYDSYNADINYKNVRFDPQNGALMATHKAHQFDPTSISIGICKTRGDYERNSQKVLYLNGHSVILEAEPSNDGKKKAEGTLDGRKFDIKGIEGAGKRNIRDKLFEASKQGAETIVLYYPKNRLFSIKRLRSQYNDYVKASKHQYIKTIYYIVNEELYQYK